VDNGRTPIQSWKKNSVRNRPFRLSKVQEVLPRSTKQEDDLGTPNTAKKKAKEVASKADVDGEGTRHQVYTPSFSHFSISSNLFRSSSSSVSKTLLSIYRIKRVHETPLLIVKPLNTYYKALDSRGGGFPHTPFGFSAASPKHHLLQCKGILKI
jgi:hypothetical protein